MRGTLIHFLAAVADGATAVDFFAALGSALLEEIVELGREPDITNGATDFRPARLGISFEIETARFFDFVITAFDFRVDRGGCRPN